MCVCVCVLVLGMCLCVCVCVPIGPPIHPSIIFLDAHVSYLFSDPTRLGALILNPVFSSLGRQSEPSPGTVCYVELFVVQQRTAAVCQLLPSSVSYPNCLDCSVNTIASLPMQHSGRVHCFTGLFPQTRDAKRVCHLRNTFLFFHHATSCLQSERSAPCSR